MKVEVNSAVEFVINILRLRQQSSPLNESQLHDFRGSLVIVLLEKYNNHWYENNPRKGSAFRCIRINGDTPEPLLEKAALGCGLKERTLRQLLPAELTLWVDPQSVSYRIGENGSISVLFDGSVNRSSPSDLDSSGSENCEMPPELNKLMLDYEKSHSNTIITKPKRYNTKNRQNNNSPPRYYPSFYHHSPSNQYYQNKAF
jgi:protein Tob/BTG